jgi:hypothetical protein
METAGAFSQNHLNVRIKTYLNGTLTSNIVIDTSQVATDRAARGSVAGLSFRLRGIGCFSGSRPSTRAWRSSPVAAPFESGHDNVTLIERSVTEHMLPGMLQFDGRPLFLT